MNLHVSPFGVIDTLSEKHFSFEEFLDYLYSISELPKITLCIEKNFQITSSVPEEFDFAQKTDIKKTVLHAILDAIKNQSLEFIESDFSSLINSLLDLSPNCLRNYRVYHHFRQQGFSVRNAKSFGFSYMLTAPNEIHSSIFALIVSEGKAIECNQILLWTRIATNMNKVDSLETDLVSRRK